MQLLIADDLTGACDSGVQFAAREKVFVALSPQSLNKSLPESPDCMLAVNTSSRLLPEPKARETIAFVADKLAPFHPAPVIKKIDSTLRGNTGVEIAALMENSGFQVCFIAPALPELGRTVINGQLLVDGIPVHETAFARDPANPVTSSSVASVLGLGKNTATIGLAEITGSHFLEHLTELIRKGCHYFVFDTTEPLHLDLIARTGLEIFPAPLFAGSAGICKAIAGRLSGHSPGAPLPPYADRILFVCGSGHEATHRQIAVLQKTGIPVVYLEKDSSGSLREITEKTGKLLSAGSVVLAAPLERHGDPVRISTALAEITLAVLTASIPAGTGLFLTGGETAAAVLGELCSYMAIGGEAAPGIVWSILADGDFKNRPVITKAGGFGEPDALLDILKLFANGNRHGN